MHDVSGLCSGTNSGSVHRDVRVPFIVEIETAKLKNVSRDLSRLSKL